jgi:small subunit ribosomal protein S18
MSKKKKRRSSKKIEAPKPRRVTKQQIADASYKDVDLLKKFISDRGKIRSTQITGITRQEQLKIARLIKISRELALLPYVSTSTYKTTYNRR